MEQQADGPIRVGVTREGILFILSTEGITFNPEDVDFQNKDHIKAFAYASGLYNHAWSILETTSHSPFYECKTKEEMIARFKELTFWREYISDEWIALAKDALGFSVENNKDGRVRWFSEIILEEAAVAERRKMEKLLIKDGKAGYVYLVKSQFSEHYKIGRTVDPENRVKTFNVKLPFEIVLEHVIFCGDMFAVEQELHRRYAAQRINGEWFALTPEQVNEIKQIKPPPLPPMIATIPMFDR